MPGRSWKNESLPLHGLDATTGERSAAGWTREKMLRALRARPAIPTPKAVRFGVDTGDIDSAGWGVIFPRDQDPAIRAALAPLLAHRRTQARAGRHDLFRDYAGSGGVAAAESVEDFLVRHRVPCGAADPKRMPYYLLLVGGPAEISYSFQHRLDLQYAVGRIHFDRLEDYAHYAESVVRAETTAPRRARRAVLFGPRHAGDEATRLSTDQLLQPLATELAAGRRRRFTIVPVLAGAASKARLTAALGAEERPAFLLTAAHGLEFPCHHPWQATRQGALVTQDWPGWGDWQGPITPDVSFAADDVPETADVAGLISFHFGCFSAGTPPRDEFAHGQRRKPAQIADPPFVAALPKRLLAHPRGGALACVGHVERAWAYSFFSQQTGAQTAAFADCCAALFARQPIGAAMESFAQRLTEAASTLVAGLEPRELGGKVGAAELAQLWTMHNDAKCYAIVGDPAVRLAV